MTSCQNKENLYFEGLVKLIPYEPIFDERGMLIPFYFDSLPFVPCRSFIVSNVPKGVVRGGHSHKKTKQFLICVQGRVEVTLRHEGNELNLSLTPANFGVLVGEGVWGQQTYVDEGSVLLVFADQPFSKDSYVYDRS